MDIQEFFSKVEADEELCGVGVDCESENPSVMVKHRISGLTTRIPVKAIEEISWEELRAILTGKREPLALQHMTRVVGYYSRIENWNKSKIGELKDRHKGRYELVGAGV